LSESTVPWVTYIQCLNLHITHGDMNENVSGCFFSGHSVVITVDIVLLGDVRESVGQGRGCLLNYIFTRCPRYFGCCGRQY